MSSRYQGYRITSWQGYVAVVIVTCPVLAAIGLALGGVVEPRVLGKGITLSSFCGAIWFGWASPHRDETPGWVWKLYALLTLVGAAFTAVREYPSRATGAFLLGMILLLAVINFLWVVAAINNGDIGKAREEARP
jgi:hypothetical protein